MSTIAESAAKLRTVVEKKPQLIIFDNTVGRLACIFIGGVKELVFSTNSAQRVIGPVEAVKAAEEVKSL